MSLPWRYRDVAVALSWRCRSAVVAWQWILDRQWHWLCGDASMAGPWRGSSVTVATLLRSIPPISPHIYTIFEPFPFNHFSLSTTKLESVNAKFSPKLIALQRNYCKIEISRVTLFQIWCPEAGGSGLPELIAYLNGTNVRRIFSLKTYVVKFISCLLAVGSGLPVGPEGPMIALG